MPVLPAPEGAGVGIVTGGSRGLGLALIHNLSEHGWRLVVDARDGRAGARRSAACPGVTCSPETSATARIAVRSSRPPVRHRPAGQQREHARAEPPAALDDYPVESSPRSSRSTSSHRSRPSSSRCRASHRSSDRQRHLRRLARAVRRLGRLWLGEGSARPADCDSRRRAAELRIYSFDPGDMRTVMHQRAFPGEDISDRPPPEESVPPCSS